MPRQAAFASVAGRWSTIFTTADPGVGRHQARREAERRHGTDRADMARSECRAVSWGRLAPEARRSNISIRTGGP